jgi:predicted permease
MSTAWQFFTLSAPLFGVVLVGYILAFWRHWQRRWTEMASQFVFKVALPALLFHLMSGVATLPPVDARLLIAFFGGCLLVFVIGRVIAAKAFALDGVSQSIFALGGIFSNNVMLGLPLARLTLGPQSLPSVALVVVFNSLILWTLVTVSIEWARHGEFTLRGIGKLIVNVLTNPIVAAILSGTAFAFTGLQMPRFIDIVLNALAQLAAPAALIVLGMGLRDYGIRSGWQLSLTICFIKLVVQPLVVWMLALALGLPLLETNVVVLLASMAVGANVYLMANQFQTLQGTVANSLVMSTALAAVTTPLLLALVIAVEQAMQK